MKNFSSILGILLLTAAHAAAQSKATALTGAWRMTQLKTTGPNSRTVTNPQPSLYLFTAGHYSIMYVTSDQPRPKEPQDASKATAAELNAVWGPFTANGGTYEVKGNTLTNHRLVAKNPAVMAPGATVTYSFKMDGKTLTLTSVTNTQGPVANPTTWTLTRVE